VSDVLPAGRERAYGHSICRNLSLNGGLSRTVSDHVRRGGTDWQAVPGLTRATIILQYSGAPPRGGTADDGFNRAPYDLSKAHFSAFSPTQ
jgi:hypothetical protein